MTTQQDKTNVPFSYVERDTLFLRRETPFLVTYGTDAGIKEGAYDLDGWEDVLVFEDTIAEHIEQAKAEGLSYKIVHDDTQGDRGPIPPSVIHVLFYRNEEERQRGLDSVWTYLCNAVSNNLARLYGDGEQPTYWTSGDVREWVVQTAEYEEYCEGRVGYIVELMRRDGIMPEGFKDYEWSNPDFCDAWNALNLTQLYGEGRSKRAARVDFKRKWPEYDGRKRLQVLQLV